MRWLDGITDSIDNEFEQALGDGERQGSLACCSPGGHKESEMTEQLNKNNNNKLNIELYDPAIPQLGIYPEELKTWGSQPALSHHLRQDTRPMKDKR